jgi:hypothetical protein
MAGSRPAPSHPGEGLRACLARYAAGVECGAELENWRASDSKRFRSLLAEMLNHVRGAAFERLALLAAREGVAATPAAGLEQGPPASEVEARARVSSGSRIAVEEVLGWAVRQTQAVRAALAEDLRPHALILGERAIPAILETGDAEALKGLLEFVETWQKALPLPGVQEWLRHRDPQVRVRALRVLHYVAAGGEAAPEVLWALTEESGEVREAACVAAARLRLMAALPLLAGLLRSGEVQAAKAAARALTEMGACGLEVLRAELAAAWSPEVAAAALEALEELKTSRYGYGVL